MPSVERVRWAKFRTIAVSLSALLILSILLYLLTGGTVFQPKATIYLYIADATGLDRDSPVRVNGITVGKVTRVSLAGTNDPKKVVRVTIELPTLSLAGIPTDSYAELGTETLIGDKFVDITSGTSPERVHNGGEIAFKEGLDLTKNLDMTQLESRLRQVDEMLTEIEQGKSRVGRFVQGEEVYNSALKRVAEAQRALRGAATTTSRVGQMLYSGQPLRQLRASVAQFDQSLAQLQSGQGSMGQFLRDPAQYEKIRADLAGLRRSVAEISSGEFFQSDRLHESWTRSLISLMETVDRFNAGPAAGTSATYDNLTGTAKELRDTLKDLRENPSKYLRLKVF